MLRSMIKKLTVSVHLSISILSSKSLSDIKLQKDFWNISFNVPSIQ